MADGSTPPPRKPRADSERNREKLLLAAGSVFRLGGGQASLEAVARAAGLGIGTLYRHFPTREALFEAVYRREVEQLADLAATLSDEADPVAALRLWLRANVGLIATKKGMLTVLALAVDSSSDLYAYSRQRLTAAIDLLLARAVAAGRIRGDVGADDLLHSLVGFCMTRNHPGWEDAVIRLVDIFVDGLCVGAAPRE